MDVRSISGKLGIDDGQLDMTRKLPISLESCLPTQVNFPENNNIHQITNRSY